MGLEALAVREAGIRNPSAGRIIFLPLSELAMLPQPSLPSYRRPRWGAGWAYCPESCRLYGLDAEVFGGSVP